MSFNKCHSDEYAIKLNAILLNVILLIVILLRKILHTQIILIVILLIGILLNVILLKVAVLNFILRVLICCMLFCKMSWCRMSFGQVLMFFRMSFSCFSLCQTLLSWVSIWLLNVSMLNVTSNVECRGTKRKRISCNQSARFQHLSQLNLVISSIRKKIGWETKHWPDKRSTQHKVDLLHKGDIT